MPDEELVTMRCFYCAVRKPWDRKHFPDRMYAKCAECIGLSPSEDKS
jgi:hypothetical protein